MGANTQLRPPLLLGLTQWGRVTHICVGKLTIIVSDNGLSPARRQAFIWNNAGILLIWPLETNFSEILIGIQTFSFKKMHLKMSSAKWRPFCLGLNVLTLIPVWIIDYIHYKLWVQSLKLANGSIIPYHILSSILGMWLFIHVGIKANAC